MRTAGSTDDKEDSVQTGTVPGECGERAVLSPFCQTEEKTDNLKIVLVNEYNNIV